MMSSTADLELGQIAEAVLYQATNLEIGQVVAASGTPDRQCRRFHCKNFSCLLIIYIDRWIVRVKTELSGELRFKRENTTGINGVHSNSPILSDVMALYSSNFGVVEIPSANAEGTVRL